MNVVGVVLAAGLGTRLRPSTDFCPKPLIPVGGVEPLFFAIAKFHALGIRRVVVNAHYLSERIEEALQRWQSLFPDMQLRCVVERPEILGTGGGIINLIQKNKDWFAHSGLLLQNGDTLAQFDLKRLVGDLKTNNFAVSHDPGHLARYNPLWVDTRGQWSGIGKQAPQKGDKAAHFLGVYFFRPQSVQKILGPDFAPVSGDLFNLLFRPLTSGGEVFCAVDFFEGGIGPREFWFDMTTQEFLLEAQRHVLSTLVTSGFWGELLCQRFPKIQEKSPGVWVRMTQTQSAQVNFRAPAVFVDEKGMGEQIETGPLVLGPHAALIFERGAVEASEKGRPTEIRNAVVFSGNKSTAGTLPATVHDRIVVI